ncbi:MAG TPA: hypothetical protein VF746_28480 [Longimicrobium sp.]
MTPSDAPAGMLPPPGTDAFPPAAPHSVPAYSRPRWPAAMSRWWRAAFAHNTYARRTDAAGSGPGGHRFFEHLIGPAADDPVAAAVAPGGPVREA